MKVHLVDGTFELFRAHFGAPSATANGQEVGAAKALMRSMANLAQSPGVSHIAVAFDTVVESFRNDLFDGYKTGEGMEPELFAQFPIAEQACHALGLVVWPMVEFEADDALATGAARYAADPRVEQVIICSPDKDLSQCVSGERVVTLDRIRKTLRNEQGVHEKFGVGPASIPDWLGLVGDAADGIPGIPRWGAKSSAAVLREYGHIEAIPDNVDDWSCKVRGAKGLAENLAANREDALLYKKLAILRTDVRISEVLDELEWKGPRAAQLKEVCDHIGMRDTFANGFNRFRD